MPNSPPPPLKLEHPIAFIEPDLSYVEYPMKIVDSKERSTQREKLECTRFSGTITLRKKLLGKPSTTSSRISLTSLERIQVPNSQSISILESQDEILFRGEAYDTSGV